MSSVKNEGYRCYFLLLPLVEFEPSLICRTRARDAAGGEASVLCQS